MEYKIAVLGAGHWGMALASILADNNLSVIVWARDEKEVERINTSHTSKYFPESVVFSDKIVATNDLNCCLEKAEFVVLSTPIKTIDSLVPYLLRHKKKYLLTGKGLFCGDVISEYLYKKDPGIQLAILSGPSFSNEIIQRKITAVAIASKNDSLAQEFQALFHTWYFRPYTSRDEIGVQLCGAVKNVYAICAGMVDKYYESDDTKSALLTRALAEMRQLISIKGGKEETLLGLAGIGDLMLTCHSEKSRNYVFGYTYSGSINTSVTTEGINSTKEFYMLAQRHCLDMPIISTLYRILYHNLDFVEGVKLLMQRNLKNELQ